MDPEFQWIAIVGATGSTGIHLAAEALDADAMIGAMAGCDLMVHLPMTPYTEAIPATLDWLSAQDQSINNASEVTS